MAEAARDAESHTRFRHPGDIIRVVVGVAIVIVGAAIIRVQSLSTFEVHIFRLFNELPAVERNVLAAVLQLGNAFSPIVLALLAYVVVRKWPLPFFLLVSGLSSWGVAKGVKLLVGRGRPADLLDGVVAVGPLQDGFGYPSGHAAVAAGLATAASVFLPKPWRRVAWGLAWMVAVGRIAVGAHLPLDVVGGVAIGLAIGAAWHLAVGVPNPPLPRERIVEVLAQYGLKVTSVRQLAVDAKGSIPLRIETTDGPYFAKVLFGLHRDADWLFKLWRRISLRRVEDETPFVSVKQEIEHEAYASMLAGRAGVPTPTVVTATSLDRHTALLLAEWSDGVPLAEFDHLPEDLWPAVNRMHAAHIAHRDLRMANILVADGNVQLLDFGFAEAAAGDARLAIDIAELLVNTALLWGKDEAVRAAKAAVPAARLEESATYLQPLALSATTRLKLDDSGDLLRDLRRGIVGRDTTQLEPMARFSIKYVVYLIALGFAVHALLPQIGEFRASISALASADYWLLGGALLASAATYVATAWSLSGSVTTLLSMSRTTLVQLANQFINIFAPAGLAGFSTNVRYLVRHGVPPDAAVAGVGLTMVTAVLVHVVMLVGAGFWVGSVASSLPSVPEKWVVVAVIAVIGLAAGVLATGMGRRKIWKPMVRGLRSLGPVLRDTGRATALFGGAIAVNVANIIALFLCLRAVGAPASLSHAATAYLIGAIVGSATPTPGGLGGTEAALVATLTGLGLEVAPAVAGVLAFRAATFWIPLVPGAYVARRLRAAHEL